MVKYGVILDAEFFEYLEATRRPSTNARTTCSAHVVARCCRLKADVVEKDEREESGLRAVLNFGHTFGHAFETLSGYGTLLHGEAVAIGMVCAAALAQRLGRIDAQFTGRLRGLLESLGLPVDVPKLRSQEDSRRHDARQEGAAWRASIRPAKPHGPGGTGG